MSTLTQYLIIIFLDLLPLFSFNTSQDVRVMIVNMNNIKLATTLTKNLFTSVRIITKSSSKNQL